MNRKVPIHSKVIGFVQGFFEDSVNNNSQWLFRNLLRKGSSLGYTAYYDLFKAVTQKYNMDSRHRPHDCRKTFVTLAKNAKVDEYALKRIVGHSITDITEKTYTDRPVSWLREEIEKIK